MIRLFANANYDFIKWRRWAYGLPAAIIIPGFSLFLVRGLNYSIEFTGGTLIQVRTPTPVGTDRIRGALDAAGIHDAEIQEFGAPNEYVVRTRLGATGTRAEGTSEATAAAVDSALAHGLGAGQYSVGRTEAVGPKVGRELQGKAFLAIFFSFIVTLIYLAFRFEWRFGLAAVLAHWTTMATTLALVLLAGEVLRPFALVMTFAIFTGTFSSIYIAAPLLMYVEKRWPGQDARGARAFRSGSAVPLESSQPPSP